MEIRKGDVVYLNKPMGFEDHLMGGNRPYVVVSNDAGNIHSDICMIVPLTTRIHKKLPTHIVVGGSKVHMATCEQIYTVSQKRIECVEYHLHDNDVKRIDNGLKIALGVSET